MNLDVSDSDLVAAIRAGDRQAFSVLVDRYQSLVCAVALAAVGEPAWAEDLAQEAFLVAWQKRHELREPHKLRSWLCGITRNVARAARRHARRHAPDALARRAPLVPVPAGQPSAVERILDREELELVRAALEAVPPSYREPLVLFYRERQSIRQVADWLDLSEAAVKQRLRRGRWYLKASVEGKLKRALPATRSRKAMGAAVLLALASPRGAVAASFKPLLAAAVALCLVAAALPRDEAPVVTASPPAIRAATGVETPPTPAVPPAGTVEEGPITVEPTPGPSPRPRPRRRLALRGEVHHGPAVVDEAPATPAPALVLPSPRPLPAPRPRVRPSLLPSPPERFELDVTF